MMPYKNLQEFLRNEKLPLSPEEAVKWMGMILNQLSTFHEENGGKYYYGRLFPQNILFTSSGITLATVSNVMNKECLSPSADILALGKIFFEMCTGLNLGAKVIDWHEKYRYLKIIRMFPPVQELCSRMLARTEIRFSTFSHIQKFLIGLQWPYNEYSYVVWFACQDWYYHDFCKVCEDFHDSDLKKKLSPFFEGSMPLKLSSAFRNEWRQNFVTILLKTIAQISPERVRILATAFATFPEKNCWHKIFCRLNLDYEQHRCFIMALYPKITKPFWKKIIIDKIHQSLLETAKIKCLEMEMALLSTENFLENIWKLLQSKNITKYHRLFQSECLHSTIRNIPRDIWDKTIQKLWEFIHHGNAQASRLAIKMLRWAILGKNGNNTPSYLWQEMHRLQEPLCEYVYEHLSDISDAKILDWLWKNVQIPNSLPLEVTPKEIRYKPFQTTKKLNPDVKPPAVFTTSTRFIAESQLGKAEQEIPPYARDTIKTSFLTKQENENKDDSDDILNEIDQALEAELIEESKMQIKPIQEDLEAIYDAEDIYDLDKDISEIQPQPSISKSVEAENKDLEEVAIFLGFSDRIYSVKSILPSSPEYFCDLHTTLSKLKVTETQLMNFILDEKLKAFYDSCEVKFIVEEVENFWGRQFKEKSFLDKENFSKLLVLLDIVDEDHIENFTKTYPSYHDALRFLEQIIPDNIFIRLIAIIYNKTFWDTTDVIISEDLLAECPEQVIQILKVCPISKDPHGGIFFITSNWKEIFILHDRLRIIFGVNIVLGLTTEENLKLILDRLSRDKFKKIRVQDQELEAMRDVELTKLIDTSKIDRETLGDAIEDQLPTPPLECLEIEEAPSKEATFIDKFLPETKPTPPPPPIETPETKPTPPPPPIETPETKPTPPLPPIETLSLQELFPPPPPEKTIPSSKIIQHFAAPKTRSKKSPVPQPPYEILPPVLDMPKTKPSTLEPLAPISTGVEPTIPAPAPSDVTEQQFPPKTQSGAKIAGRGSEEPASTLPPTQPKLQDEAPAAKQPPGTGKKEVKERGISFPIGSPSVFSEDEISKKEDAVPEETTTLPKVSRGSKIIDKKRDEAQLFLKESPDTEKKALKGKIHIRKEEMLPELDMQQNLPMPLQPMPLEKAKPSIVEDIRKSTREPIPEKPYGGAVPTKEPKDIVEPDTGEAAEMSMEGGLFEFDTDEAGAAIQEEEVELRSVLDAAPEHQRDDGIKISGHLRAQIPSTEKEIAPEEDERQEITSRRISPTEEDKKAIPTQDDKQYAISKRKKAALPKRGKPKEALVGGKPVSSSFASLKMPDEKVKDTKMPPIAPCRFASMVEDDVGKPGPFERLVAQSVIAMKTFQAILGLYFILFAHALDIIIQAITSYITNIFNTWKTLKTVRRALQRQLSGRQTEAVYEDFQKGRIFLLRFLRIPGFHVENCQNIFPKDKKFQELTQPSFHLKIALEMRGHLDEMRRDLSLLTASQAAEFAKKGLRDFFLSFIPNPADFIMPWKDFFLVLFCIKYSRSHAKEMYMEYLWSYIGILQGLIEKNQTHNRNVHYVPNRWEKELFKLFSKRKNDDNLEHSIGAARKNLQNILLLSCKLHNVLYPRKWKRWELLLDVYSMSKNSAQDPLVFLELERWLRSTIGHILHDKGWDMSLEERQKQLEEVKDFHRRYTLHNEFHRQLL